MHRYEFSLQYPKPLTSEELETVNDVARSGHFSRYTSSIVEDLEHELARLFGAEHAVTCSSGTAAIHAALIALDLPVGGEVITTSVTDVGVVLPIIYQNLVPVFADVEQSTFNLDPASVEMQISSDTCAIIAVHLAGNPCRLEELMRIAERHGLVLIEDCSQAHGAEYEGRPVGSRGTVAVASLQQSKHITSGEGGVIATNDRELHETIKLAVDKGWTRHKGLRERTYEFLSLNYRYTAIQAAVVLPQVRRFPELVAKKRRLAELFYEGLDRHSERVRCQRVIEGGRHSYYSFPAYVTADEAFRDRLLSTLATDFAIECAYGYANPKPLYMCTQALQDPQRFGRGFRYSERTYLPGTCPVAEDLLSRSFLFPFNESYEESDVSEITRRFADALEAVGA